MQLIESTDNLEYSLSDSKRGKTSADITYEIMGIIYSTKGTNTLSQIRSSIRESLNEKNH